MTERSRSAGFTLVEVVVALLVLEVGIVAAAGTLVVAARTLARAHAEERAVSMVESVLDSLSAGASPGTSTRVTEDGTVMWTVSDDGSVRVRCWPSGGSVVVGVTGAVSVVEAVGP